MAAGCRYTFGMTNHPLTGPEAIEFALSRLDLGALEQEQRDVIAAKKKTARPRAVRMLHILDGLRKNKVQPTDLMLRSVPVIPPKFRPFSVTGNTFLPGDANELYRDIVEYRRLHDRAEKDLGREGAADVYTDLAAAVRAAYGYGESPNPKIRSRGVKGFFDVVTGSNPKTSFYQSRMLSKPVDTVGRGVIVPDADLGMDDVGIPEEMAWKMYGSYVQRRMVRGGMSPSSALQHLQDRSPQARKALAAELPERPVVITRSPAWHRTNVIGQTPHLVDGDAIRVNTYITEGQNADFDGDEQCSYTVFAISRSLVSDFPSFLLTAELPASTVQNMFNKLAIPAIDTATNAVFVVDLQDFPHGELIGAKTDTTSHVKFYLALPGTRVVAYDESTASPVWADVYGWSEHVGPTVEIVNLEANRQIFTDDDPRAVYGIDPASGDFELRRFTPSQALAAGAVVPFVRSVRDVMQSLGASTEVVVTDNPECAFSTLQLDYAFGWWLGVTCGDGWWDKRDYPYYQENRKWAGSRCLNLSDLTGFNAVRASAFVVGVLDPTNTCHYHRQEHFKADRPDRYGDTVRHSYNFLHSELMAAFLDDQLGGAGDDTTSGSGNKHLPLFSMHAPDEFRRGLLCGLVDSDGTVAVSMGKGKPQLMCSFGTTSLRLAREVQMLCSSLGISAAVSFSQTTTAGNASWIVTMSAVDCKRTNVFVDLACDWKRDNFVNTAVELDNTSVVFDKVVFPRHLCVLISRDLPDPKIYPQERQCPVADRSDELLARMEAQSLGVLLRKARDTATIPRVTWARIRASLDNLERGGEKSLNDAIAHLTRHADTGCAFGQELADLCRDAIRAVSPKQDTPERYKHGCAIAARLNQPLKAGHAGPKLVRGVLEYLRSTPRYVWAHQREAVTAWESKFVTDDRVCWSHVVSVEKTGKQETGYDLTVPGYETFMSADGVILSNTMSVHVPSGDAAVKDVREKLMASNMLWSIKDRTKTMGNPKHEQILGLTMGHNSGGVKRKFRTDDDAMKAIESGQIDLNDDVEIGD